MAHRIRDGRDERDDRPAADLRSVVADVQTAFAEEANHELRQVLFQLSAQLELALVKRTDGDVTFSRDEVMRLLRAVGRATSVVEAYLDRGAAVKMVIDLQVERFDVGAALDGLLRANGLLDSTGSMSQIDRVVVEADRGRLIEVFGHLARRFRSTRLGPGRLRITLRDEGDHVAGFFGLIGSTVTRQELIAELDPPVETEDMQIDMDYTRAIIERHGGTLYVAAGPDDASGFGFTLPKRHKTRPEV